MPAFLVRLNDSLDRFSGRVSASLDRFDRLERVERLNSWLDRLHKRMESRQYYLGFVFGCLLGSFLTDLMSNPPLIFEGRPAECQAALRNLNKIDGIKTEIPDGHRSKVAKVWASDGYYFWTIPCAGRN